jgi:hypothetical protein
MERMEFEGRWWLLENPDHKVPGRLVVADDEIELSLLGALRKYTAGGDTVIQQTGLRSRPSRRSRWRGQASIPASSDSRRWESSTHWTTASRSTARATSSAGWIYSASPSTPYSRGVHLDDGALGFSEIVIQMDGLVQFVNRSGFSEEIRREEVDGRLRVRIPLRMASTTRLEVESSPTGRGPPHSQSLLLEVGSSSRPADRAFGPGRPSLAANRLS